MEYKIYKAVRNYFNVHVIIRFFLGSIFGIIGIIIMIIPFPASFPVGLTLFIFSVLLIIPAHKIKHVVKMRKGFIYLAQNFYKKQIITHKMRDISGHIKEILDTKNKL
ncbi:MAG: hypothetical protein GY828_04250 [Candidatus Gracilibacteria bacterium]|nr:hypothetical protein [Candidatus Gracilibacteria bacterium]